MGEQSKFTSTKGSGLTSAGVHRKREGMIYRERQRTHTDREERRRSVRGDNVALGNKKNVSSSAAKDRTVTLSDVIDDLGDMKVVFAHQGTSIPSKSPLTAKTPPPPPPSPNRIPPPPIPPAPPSAPMPPKVSPPSSRAPEVPQHAVKSSASIPIVGGSSVSHDAEDEIFFTIAPPTEERDIGEATWPKSIGLSLDEEIERARASRPLVRSPEVVQSRDEKIRLNVVSTGNSGETSVPLDKSTLKPLPQEEEAMIDRHEIPDVISERVGDLDQEKMKQPFNKKSEEALSDKKSEKRFEEIVSSFIERQDEKILSSSSSSCKRSSPCEDVEEATTSVELPPLASWTALESNNDDQEPCVKVSFDKKDGKRIATIILQKQPTCIMSVVKALHQAITAVEEGYHEMDDSVTYVLLTTLPTLNFFEAKQGSLELSCAERVEFLREKERLLTRLASTPQRLCFISVAYVGVVGDFGAELFLTCHHRFLLGPSETTFGFPSLQLGDFPSAHVVRQLGHCFGSQRAIELVPRLHEYRTDSLIDAGLVRCAHSVQEVLSILTTTTPTITTSFGEGAIEARGNSPSLLLWLERKLLMLFSKPEHKTLLLRKLFFTRSFETSMVVTGPNPLLQTWVRYSMAAITQGKIVDDENKVQEGQTHSEKIFSEMTYSVPAINAANVHVLEKKMVRRVVMPFPGSALVTFRREEMPLWSEKMKAVVSASSDVNDGDDGDCKNNNNSNNNNSSDSGKGTVTVLLDCSRRCLEATTRLVSEHRAALRGVSVVFVGPAAGALPLLALLPCGAVVSPAGPFAPLQELRLFARPCETPPADRCRQLTAAAAAFVRSEHRPAVACRGSCGHRLVAAVAAAACRVASGCGAGGIARVDGVAVSRRLGMRVGPFRLIDSCGTDAVLRMMQETNTMNVEGNPLLRDNIPAIAQHTLQYMSTDGFLGAQARRGGFYTYRKDGTPIGPNSEVQEQYLRRRLTDAEIADILLAVIVNECCEMLLTERIQCAQDANMLTIAAIGFRETTGGALALADAKGIRAMVQTMEDLAEWHGSHLRPSPLLKCMAHSNVSFASLSEATIQSARM
ncbi:3-hydroxyacyl-CoA dehydrogenase [Trypanosoma theileri]|uniref:3-hydroxyacyl-CoA dehydrogenase n=1 Tax=Trypanosoma theileri TaxID=67003 RepID=A0A1X0NIW0_9TRYP|nr:3-hydroxyacyl-CoA dehydrogenase [Trypanosoma theileri]ORC84704.1 3-hydroxyacyl-CoA dehydrogenase [Trypanosoma theileri]